MFQPSKRWIFALGASAAFAALIAGASPAGYAAVVAEAEPNNARITATPIPLSAFTLPAPTNVFGALPTATLTGSISNDDDVDFFSFAGVAGEQVYFDVDNSPRTLDTFLSLFSGNGTLLALADDSERDPGSASGSDAFLGVFTLPTNDTYYLAVSEVANFPRVALFPPPGATFSPLTRPDGLGGGEGGYAMSGATPGEDRFAGGGFGTGAYTVQFSRTASVIPEPSSMALMSLGMAGMAASLRRRRKARHCAER